MKSSNRGHKAAPKKARWTRAQKLEAQRAKVRKQVRGRPGDRDDARRDEPRRDDARRDDVRRSAARDDRRPPRGDRRDGYRRDDSRRDDDRPQRRFDRDERPQRSNRRDDDRPQRRFDRDERPRRFERDERGSRFDRDDRRGDRRDERGDRFGRDDRPRRFERDDRPQRRFDRDERPRRFERDDRGDRFNRDDRRGDRRDERGDRFGRDERRDRRDDRFDRRDRFQREDRPQRRDDRDDRAPRREERDTPAAQTAPVETPAASSDEPIDMQDNGFAALGLPDLIVERLARDGITKPFPIQAATIPDALAGRDVLGRGRTGSGKTLSFGLPTLARLAAGGKARPHQPRAIVLTPTRELAMQVSDALMPLVHVIGLRHKLVAGGMPYEPQLQALQRGVDLLVATPGRLMDLIERGAADLSRVEIAILDEADHMAEMGFLEAITEILDQIPEGGQRLLFSATLDRGIDTVVDRYLVDPVTHSTDDGTASVATMSHHALLIDPQHKKVVTAEVANRPGRTVVFCRTKLGADRVARELRDLGVVAAALHGGLNQGQRNKVLSAFKDGRVPVLVATDVAARGIHVDDVGVVLQLDPPADHKDYLHRAGRTARAGESGTVVTLALPHQRKVVQRLLDEAGVDTTLVRAQPGDDVIAQAGGSTPSGEQVSEDDLYRLLTPNRGRAGRGGGRGGPRRGGYGGSGGYGGPGGGGGYGGGRRGGPRRDGERRHDGGRSRGPHRPRRDA
ncbi:superfamily II DNA/RNA helicase [Barrientosiimonas humi]|uniref:Superfamily II DNA/RNA helicase n=1 Tax=Barrientosiimonas humi TaxID=999931 RepID=A0A542XDB0_9MICO|nr:DEAD/DEAH box helicase [Barrientosiimonas humi]TQL33830.1 superfamily II DNA/RNA helicase [Barrientosiimonas humi]CAG7573818.1 ATP-dependent RNA helicase DeaD [Barrientosiimonas humi]